MKLFIVVAAVVVAALAIPQKDALGSFECMICESLVASSENWLGHEGEQREAAAIAECVKDLKPVAGDFGAIMICNTFVKQFLDQIIAHMEDPNYQHEDAEKVCHAIGLCK